MFGSTVFEVLRRELHALASLVVVERPPRLEQQRCSDPLQTKSKN
jgi:hypothetical protein